MSPPVPSQPPTDEQIADFTRQALARDPYVEKHNIIVECENAHAPSEWCQDREDNVVFAKFLDHALRTCPNEKERLKTSTRGVQRPS